MEKSDQNNSFGQELESVGIINKAITSAVKKTSIIFKFFEDSLIERVETKFSILKLISGGKEIMIESSDGKLCISENKKLFQSYISPDFKNWELNKPGLVTVETLLDVYEMTKDTTLFQMFKSLNSDLDKLVMTQNQIVCFCKKHPIWLHQDGYANFFLIKENNNFFVVSVYVCPISLRVYVNHLRNDSIWNASFRRRLIVPQLNFF